MKTAIRKPKINKPSKGMKTFFKQQKNRVEKALNRATRRASKFSDRTGFDKKKARTQWLRSFTLGSYMPHQGPQECARRVRQMKAGTHGY